MGRIPVGSSGVEVELPKLRVGVVQHEPEALLTPAHDLRSYLRGRPERWHVQTFDERNFGALLGAAAAYDVIVIGHNALLHCVDLRTALAQAPPATPLLVLHQRDPACWTFLEEALALDVTPLPERPEQVWVSRERTPGDEPLLAWPHADVVDGEGALGCTAIRGFAIARGPWRVAMEAQRGAQRLPVLVRTPVNYPRRVVASTLLLRPAHDRAHGHLLDNLLTYCALGWPDVAVADVPGLSTPYGTEALTRTLRVWSESCFHVSLPAEGELPLDLWPLRSVRRLVVPDGFDPERIRSSRSGMRWMHRGGTLVRIGASGTLTYHVEVADRLLVLRRWAAWFGALATEDWAGRLSSAQAVLRFMAELGPAERKLLADDLGFDADPREYRGHVARLLAERVGSGNVDETISATTAALDLHQLTGELALSPWTARNVRAWLSERLAEACPEDQLDILRSLRDRDGLVVHLGRANEKDVSALYATRLRDAVFACWPDGGETPDLVPAPLRRALGGEHIADELAERPLLCAEYLVAFYRESTKRSSVDLGPCAAAERTALETLRGLAATDGAADARSACLYTLALLGHLQHAPVAALRVLPEAGELPGGALQSVLEEATRARGSEREARRDLPALATAVMVLGTIALALAVVALLATWHVWQVRIVVRPWWLIAPALATTFGALAALRWGVLPQVEKRADRLALRLAQTLCGLGALAAALVAGTFAWRAGGSLAGSLALGPLAFATAFAALVFILRRFRIAPAWARELIALTSDIKSPLAGLTARLQRREPQDP